MTKTRLASWAFLAAIGALTAPACTNDYGSYSFGAGGSTAGGGKTGTGGTAGKDGGSGGSVTGGTGGTGGVVTGGTGGVVTGGTGGVVTGGTGGVVTGGTGGVVTGGTGGTGGSQGCNSNQKLCNLQCVAINDPQWGCAGVGCNPCVFQNASATCSQGQCAIGNCNAGFANCDNSADNGCETALNTISDCGSCGRACSSAHSTGAECHQGACLHTCDAGWGDCTQPTNGPDNGCETDLTTAEHCGACTNSCGQQGFNGGFACVSGACGCSADAQCLPNSGVTGSCDTNTGLCTCGSTTCNAGEHCGTGSSGCRCNGGSACQNGSTCCPNGCKNLMSDSANCGGCGIACPGGQSCQNGQCG